MAIDDNSYGTLAGVGAMVPMYSDDGAFTASVRPSSGTVEAWIDQVSSLLNVMLKKERFTIPVEQADAVKTLTLFVETEVADLVLAVNGSGRFGPNAKDKNVRQRGRWATILDDIKDFVESMAFGLEEMGVERPETDSDGIGSRDQDEGGDDTFPIFQRKGFGNSFHDWDS